MLLGLLIGVPAVLGAFLLVLRPSRGAVAVGIGTAGALLVLAVAAVLVRPSLDLPLLAGIRAGLAVDDLSAVLVLLVPVVLLASLVVAASEADLRTGRFQGLMLLFAAAMLGTVTATTLSPLLIAWEVMGATSWALIGYRSADREATRAADVAFLTTRTADLGMYVAGGAMLAGGAGGLALADLAGVGGGWLHLAVAGLVLAALGKSAQLPFSFWLSGAMHGPSPVSALLHSATMVAAGAYLLLRLSPALAATGWAGPAVAWVGLATALLLGLVAVAQDDLKQLLAASTCSQIGYVVAAAGNAGLGAGLLQTVAHAAAKSLLFLVAGIWLARWGSRSLSGALSGAARRAPVVGVAFTVGALALAGVPPFGLWIGKDAVLATALTGSAAQYLVGLAAAWVAALYSAKALWFVWRPARGERVVVGAPVALVTVVLAVGAAAAGLLAFVPALRPEPSPQAWELVVSALIAVIGVGLASRIGDRWPAPTPLSGWLGLESLAVRGVVRPTLALATALARVDDGLDRAVTGTARGVLGVARVVERGAERGGLDRAVRGVARGARGLGAAARRPQTGQVHQYYAQASVGFALLAALAVLVIVVR